MVLRIQRAPSKLMKIFHIYIAPSGEVAVVKQGFSWPAAIFGVWWALGKRYWFTGFAMVGAGLVLRAFFHDSSLLICAPIVLGSRTYIGLNANRWRAAQLVVRGYQNCGIVEVKSTSKAPATV